ncbi:hypothetical protein BB559_006739 [Furculomyces boomerangus]|uniref:40S ribosomal protein S8 n=2 Tax=Harpellales TaxID=61421 RepID=A0A2T9Y0U9_9FUNG|nr:hypothetical protein BB559_006739 [Furculomyces boomerangus]PWA03158.1 hypothetical protein BB558_000678 [Smittium angustum]
MSNQQTVVTNQDRYDDISASLKVYYCLCGDYALIIEKQLAELPVRPVDGSHVIDNKKYIYTLSPKKEKPIIIKRGEKFEKQYRYYCTRCKLPIAYDCVETFGGRSGTENKAPYTYILKDSLSENQVLSISDENNSSQILGISRDSRHKRSHTGAKRAHYRKKRKFDLGRQPANTKLGPKRIHEVRVRGGNKKFRALRLDTGNFSWPGQSITRKTRIVAVAYNASNNELVRTNTLVKGAIIQVDATPFRQWYENHFALPLDHLMRKVEARKSESKIDQQLEDQFGAGRLYAIITSRPGQSGRCDGYILEGKELDFYLRKIRSRK